MQEEPLPVYLFTIILIDSRPILPSRDMNIHKLPILVGSSLSHNINNLLSSRLNRKICTRAAQVGTQPLYKSESSQFHFSSSTSKVYGALDVLDLLQV
jgi:hypothetical protein